MTASSRPRRTCCCCAAAAAGKPPLPGSGRSESRGRPERVSARPGPRSAPGRAPPGPRRGVPGRVSERPVLAGERACACPALPHPGPSLGFLALRPPPPASLPGAACPNPNHLCTRETQLLPLGAPGGDGGRATPQRGPLPPPASSPSPPRPGLTLPPREGCLEGSGRPKPKPRSASYDQLGVCLLLPRAQVGEQASIQNMSEGGDGQGRGVGEDHHQRGRHAT